MTEKIEREIFNLTCGACKGEFQSRERSPKICPLCHSTLYRYREGKDSITSAPRSVLIALISPIVQEDIADPEKNIINLKILDYDVGEKLPDWNKIIKQSRMKVLVATLAILEPNLERTTKNDGITKSHLFYRRKQPPFE